MERHDGVATVNGDDERIQILEGFYAAEMRYVALGGPRGGATFDEMAAYFHPTAVMRQGPSTPFPGDWSGIDGVERFFRVLSDTWSAAEGLDLQYYTGARGVAVSMHVTLTSRATGRSVDAHLAQFVSFADGLIADFAVQYLDPVAVSAVCYPNAVGVVSPRTR